MNVPSSYDENYYERGVELGISGYSHYRWMPEMTIPMCARMCEYLGIKRDDLILDYGAAKGFSVKAFRLLGRAAYGYDTSEYALSQAPSDVRPFLSNELGDDYYDWIIAKDVFEHMSSQELDITLNIMRTDNLFVVVPLGKEGKYIVPSYEHDITHVIREPLEWWENKFKRAGFEVLEATYRIEGIKDNYAHFPKGNGFFVLSLK